MSAIESPDEPGRELHVVTGVDAGVEIVALAASSTEWIGTTADHAVDVVEYR